MTTISDPAARPLGATSSSVRMWCGVVLLLAVGMPQRLVGEDWPAFRGPTGQGAASGTARWSWDLAKDIRWEASPPGKGWSSPVVVQGRVYLTTAVTGSGDNDKQLSLRALCLDGATGREIWNVQIFEKQIADDEKIHKKNSFASPTPIVDGERIYVHFGADGTAALDLDGRIVWANQEIKYNPQHGGGGSPIVSQELLVFICDGVDDPFVIALHRDSGREAWRTPRPEAAAPRFSFCTPLEIEVAGTRQIVCPAAQLVCSYEPTSGRELWCVRYPNKWSIVPRPVFGHGLVYVCTGYDGPAELLAIDPTGRGDVSETHVVWRTDENVSQSPSPLLVGNEIFLVSDNGIASCRDARSGALHWRRRLGGNYSASPIVVDGRIYFHSEEGVMTVIAAATEFTELARCDFGEPTLASPAVADNGLFIRTESKLYRID